MGLLQVLSSETNLDILRLLKSEPTYPRRLATLMGKKEQKIVPRLRALEKAGLLTSSWRRIGRRNVKVYEASAERIELLLGAGGLQLVFHPTDRRQDLSLPLYLPPKFTVDESFVGRTREMDLLGSSASFIVVEGMAGIGKTSLLRAFASRFHGDHRVFWHTFKETDSFSHLVTKLAAFLAEFDYLDLLEYTRGQGREDSAKIDLLLKGIDHRDYILILDDYQRQSDDMIDTLLGSLQREVARAKVVLASRVRPRFLLTSDRLLELRLDGLTEEESSQFFRNKRLGLNNERKAFIYRKTTGHPLALTLVCAILRERTQLVEALGQIAPLENLSSEFLQTLSHDERELLIPMSVFRDPIPLEGVLEVLKGRGIRVSLHSLERKMILKRSDGSYLLHELVREGCYKMIDYPADLHRRVGEWYLSKRSPPEILEGLHHFVKAKDTSKVNQIMMQELEHERFRFVEEGFAAVLLDILGPIRVEQLGPREACSLLCIEAKALSSLHEWRKAKSFLIKAQTLAKSLNDRMALACVHTTLGKHYVQKGDLAEGERHLLLSCDLLRTTGDSGSLGRLYLDLAKLHFTKGDVEGSLKYIDYRERLRGETQAA